MTTTANVSTTRPNRAAVTRHASGKNITLARDRAAGTANPRAPAPSRSKPPAPSPASKRALLLQLLHRREGASIEDMARAAHWQKHSVRGFLAGTVKKKLGLLLASAKDDGGVRRYKIATRRGR